MFKHKNEKSIYKKCFSKIENKNKEENMKKEKIVTEEIIQLPKESDYLPHLSKESDYISPTPKIYQKTK